MKLATASGLYCALKDALGLPDRATSFRLEANANSGVARITVTCAVGADEAGELVEVVRRYELREKGAEES